MFELTDGVSGGFSMSHVREWAGEIANSFFASNALPTDTLTKIAKTEELTPHQVEVLAAEANKLIHAHKYAGEGDKYHAADFPMADAREAVKCLQVDGGTVKVAARFSEPVANLPELDLYKAFGVQPEELDKTANIKHHLKNAEEKATLLKQKIDDKLFEVKTAAEVAQHTFIKMARQSMLEEGTSLDRLSILGKLDQFVKIAGFAHGKKLLAKVAYVLMKEGKLEPSAANKAIAYFTKEGDQKAPQELISENLPCQVINGQHPLYISLKTVGDLEAEMLRYQQEGLLVMDKLRILKQRVRAL